MLKKYYQKKKKKPKYLGGLSCPLFRRWQAVAWKEYRAESCLKESQESIGGCLGPRDITERTFKKALNTKQLINLSGLSAVLSVKRVTWRSNDYIFGLFPLLIHL